MVQEAARTGFKETPSESMDQKAMIVCICLWVLNIWISFLALSCKVYLYEYATFIGT